MKFEHGEPCKVKWWGLSEGHKRASRMREVRSRCRTCLIGNSLRAGSDVGEERAWEKRLGKGSRQGWRVRTGKRALSQRGHYRKGADLGGWGAGQVACSGGSLEGSSCWMGLEAHLEPMISLGIRDLGFQTICFV